MHRVELNWADFKTELANRSGILQSEFQVQGYYVYFFDSLVEYCTFIPNSTDENYVEADWTEFTTTYLPISNKTIENKDAQGRSHVVSEPRDGTEVFYPTHNFCDKTTWYPTSVLETDKVLTPQAGDLVFDSGHVFIDLYNKKLWNEHKIRVDAAKNDYQVSVKIDDVVQDPVTYTVDYRQGTITFGSAVTGVVKATYCRMVDSCFPIIPAPGTLLYLEKAKVQLSNDIDLTESLIVQTTLSGMPVKETIYQTIKDFMRECSNYGGLIPQLGTNSLGIQVPIHLFEFNYRTMKPLDSTYNLQMKIYMETHQEITGYEASASFYCTLLQL